MDTDEQLITKVLKGNIEAFEFIVNKYKNYVFGVCFNIIKDTFEAENLAQETFIKVYDSLNKYEFKGFKTYITRIAVNKSIDYKRKIASQNAHSFQYIDELENTIVSKEPPLYDQFIKKYDKHKIITVCSELPPIYSAVIKKYYFQTKSYKAIAQEENISVKTVESRLYRAKQLIREKLEEINFD
jgi:RNA polymerase sigma factor (sigma-70 family)